MAIAQQMTALQHAIYLLGGKWRISIITLSVMAAIDLRPY